jgi:hypothetical protein
MSSNAAPLRRAANGAGGQPTRKRMPLLVRRAALQVLHLRVDDHVYGLQEHVGRQRLGAGHQTLRESAETFRYLRRAGAAEMVDARHRTLAPRERCESTPASA